MFCGALVESCESIWVFVIEDDDDYASVADVDVQLLFVGVSNG